MSDRKLLSSLVPALAPNTLHYLNPWMLQLRSPDGIVLFIVDPDEIFDADGMRFENDLEITR